MGRPLRGPHTWSAALGQRRGKGCTDAEARQLVIGNVVLYALAVFAWLYLARLFVMLVRENGWWKATVIAAGVLSLIWVITELRS